MKRLLLSLSFLVFHISVSVAQTPVTAKEINAIKRDTTYIYAEVTMKDVKEAIIGAKSILEVKVGDWLRSQHPNECIEVCIAKAKEHSFEIQTRRGDYYRAFVYVKKSDILPVTSLNEVVVFQIHKEDDPLPTIDEVISEGTPPEEKVPSVTLTTEEEKMVTITSFYDVEPYIKDLRDKNELEAYGKYATMPADSACHLFIYDQQGRVKAVLRKTSDIQINLNTLKEDNVKNYRNCGAIWFRLKD